MGLLLSSALLLTLGLTVVMSMALWSQKADLHQETLHYIERNQALDRERELVLRDPRFQKGDMCSDTMLSLYRETLLDFDFVKDILVFGNDRKKNLIFCSALVGKLASPLEVTGTRMDEVLFRHRKLWRDVRLPLYPRVNRHHVVRDGRIGIVADLGEIAKEFAPGTRQLFYRDLDGNFSSHIFGNPKLIDISRKKKLSDFFWVTDEQCNIDLGAYCILMAHSPSVVFHQQSVAIAFGVGFSICLTIFFFLLGRKYLQDRSSVTGRVARALKSGKGGFHCHYQPIVDLHTGQIAGCEVLARLTDRYGRLSPQDFIPVIEKKGWTWIFTEEICRLAARDIQMLGELPQDFRLSLNFFPDDLCDENFENISESAGLRQLRQTNVQLVCEILETGVSQHRSACKVLGHFCSIGIHLAIDDFGTGFSNLQQLKAIKPDYLKIDRSFTEEIDPNTPSVNAGFFRHIVAIGKDVGVKMIAEGVETLGQAETLQAYDIPYAQGFLFSRPVPINEFSLLLFHSYPLSARSRVVA